MKKKPASKSKSRRNNGGGRSSPAPRRSRTTRRPRRAAPPSFRSMAAAAAGAVGGAVASGLIVNQRIAKPETISLVMTATGGLGAYLTDGDARVAFTGAAAAGAGQLALAYLGKSALRSQTKDAETAASPATAPPAAHAAPPAQLPTPAAPAPRRQDAGGGVVVDLFRDAAADLAALEEDQWRYGLHDDEPGEGVIEIDLDEAA